MEYMNYSDLNRLSEQVSDSALLLEKSSYEAERHRVYLGSQMEVKTRDVFLSHSSKDGKFLPSVITFFARFGASVYTDKQDKELPQKPGPDTGAILKDAIDACRKFVLFVTPNSKDSRWIPWELGIGDSKKTLKNVALLPAIETSVASQDWPRQEYLGLYSKIMWGRFEGRNKDEWIVYNHHDNTGTALGEWLK